MFRSGKPPRVVLPGLIGTRPSVVLIGLRPSVVRIGTRPSVVLIGTRPSVVRIGIGLSVIGTRPSVVPLMSGPPKSQSVDVGFSVLSTSGVLVSSGGVTVPVVQVCVRVAVVHVVCTFLSGDA